MNEDKNHTLDDIILKSFEAILINDGYIKNNEEYSVIFSGKVKVEINNDNTAKFSVNIIVTPSRASWSDWTPNHAHYTMTVLLSVERFPCPDRQS